MSDVLAIEVEAGIVDGEGTSWGKWTLEPERGQVDPEEIEIAMRSASDTASRALMAGQRWATVTAWWEHRAV